MINQYWSTFSDWASLSNSKKYVDWLNQIPNPGSQADGVLLHTAKSNARNRMLAAEIQLGRSLSELMEFIPTGDPNQSPVLPMDSPLISKYKTHYDWYNSRQMIPPQLKGIDKMLPKTLELITSRAQTVRNAQSATKQTQNALSSGQSNIATVLEAGRLWQESLDGFVATVVAYNQAIGDYAMTISNNSRSPEQIVGMLIPVSKTDDVVRTAPPNTETNPGLNNGNRNPAFSNSASADVNVSGQNPMAQSGINSRLSDGSQPIGPNAGTYRPARPGQPANNGTLARPAAPVGTGVVNGQGPQGVIRPGQQRQMIGDMPPRTRAPQNQTFQPPTGGNPNAGGGGGFRPPDSQNRTTDRSNSFGGDFQR